MKKIKFHVKANKDNKVSRENKNEDIVVKKMKR